MVRIPEGIVILVLVGLCVSPLVVHAGFFQEKEIDPEKLYKEIAGDYEFDVQGEMTVLIFYVENGVLLAAVEGDDEVVEIEPVNLEKMEFEATDEDGQYYEFRFVRDEDGEVTRFFITTQGMEFEGVKLGG